MNEVQRQWLKGIPKVYQQNYNKAIEGRSRTAAIRAKCLDCTNWQRVEIADCLVETCPLFPYRPYRSSKKPRNPQKTGNLKEKTRER